MLLTVNYLQINRHASMTFPFLPVSDTLPQHIKEATCTILIMKLRMKMYSNAKNTGRIPQTEETARSSLIDLIQATSSPGHTLHATITISLE